VRSAAACGSRAGTGQRAQGLLPSNLYFADAEADYAALVFAVELVFPEGW